MRGQLRSPMRTYFEELVRAAAIAEPKHFARQLVILHEGAIAFAQVLGGRSVAASAKVAAEKLLGARGRTRLRPVPAASRSCIRPEGGR